VAHPILSLAIALLPLGALVLGSGLWSRAAAPARPSPVARSGDAAAGGSERFGWQWCPDSPGAATLPSKVAPTETGARLTARKGPLNIDWSWCRSRSSDGRLIVRAQVTNAGDDAINLVLLDFSLYDQTGSFIGNHSVTMRKLDAHGTGQIEETLPSQYAEWKWTVWSMKLASAVAN
jgi:hypothetical protein